jgi:predicted regulator of Ras-like GTPase activity (Roadblock/LC7/MglB family)
MSYYHALFCPVMACVELGQHAVAAGISSMPARSFGYHPRVDPPAVDLPEGFADPASIFFISSRPGPQPMQYTFDNKDLALIEEVLQRRLIDIGVHCAALIDMSGAIIAVKDNGLVDHDIVSMAILAASNFSAASAIADRIGEDEFSLLFHKGKKENIYFNKVTAGFLLITIFDKALSVGFLRLGVAETIGRIRRICRQCLIPAKPIEDKPSSQPVMDSPPPAPSKPTPSSFRRWTHSLLCILRIWIAKVTRRS